MTTPHAENTKTLTMRAATPGLGVKNSPAPRRDSPSPASAAMPNTVTTPTRVKARAEMNSMSSTTGMSMPNRVTGVMNGVT